MFLWGKKKVKHNLIYIFKFQNKKTLVNMKMIKSQMA